ncbi:zinc finger protein, putative [Ixodes scapularis]|uniref:Palmitoyltransferase n=1 Tax=Ixodes scapularis TaxID=6945 RepID=B7QHD1_IXOSC|nr:zinc finger protein, putative [Ixodes scapularis]|eukprot:XP_002414588.1 zinc finger protein, putative [Ixodes scapularis]
MKSPRHDAGDKLQPLLPQTLPRKTQTGVRFGGCLGSFLRLLRVLVPSCSAPRGRIRSVFNVLRRAPIIFEFVILAWAYYAYVVLLCNGLLFERGLLAWFFRLLGFHLTLLGSLWPFERMLSTPLKPVPVCFYVMQRLDSDDRKRRYCYKCHVIKPDRCHHCSLCDTCVLKMDHHCPWFNTCVSFNNYKYFLLFLFYSTVHCAYISCTTYRHFGIETRMILGFWPDISITFLFLMALFFGAAFLLLFLYHLFLVCKNRTTLEMISRSERGRYDLGVCRNMAQVLGPQKRLWLVPVYTTPGDGTVFPSAQEFSRSGPYAV